MKPAPFTLQRPTTISEAVDLLGTHGEEAKILAGGQSLVPMLALRLTRFEQLVDVNGVEELSGIDHRDGWLRIGATARHRSVEKSDVVATTVPLLSRATARVGHFQIRNRGTVGGSIAHADPAAEQPAVALALDAVMEVRGPGGAREVDARDFFTGTWATALEADELLAAVRFPVWTRRSGFAVEEVAQRAGDFALVGVVCAVSLNEMGAPARAAIALFGVGSTPLRMGTAEAALVSGTPMPDVVSAVEAAIEPVDDLHASARYRRRVAGVLVDRAVTRALEEARSV